MMKNILFLFLIVIGNMFVAGCALSEEENKRFLQAFAEAEEEAQEEKMAQNRFKNTDPKQPWNNRYEKNDLTAPWNDPILRDDATQPWNNP